MDINSTNLYLLILVPALTGLAVFIFGRWKILRDWLSFLGMAFTFYISSLVFLKSQGQVITAFNGNLRVDALSGLFVGMIGLLGLVVIIYSMGYFEKSRQKGVLTEAGIKGFYWQALFLISAMMWAVTINNIIMFWAIIELATVPTALLIVIYRKKESYEAAFKYVVIIAVGISFALLGSMMLYCNVLPIMTGGGNPMQMDAIAAAVVQGTLPAASIAITFTFLLCGFGTKAAMTPFHTWLPEAHSETTAPMSALFSAALPKIGVYALFRTVTMFFMGYQITAILVTIMGVVTIIVGVSMMLIQDDIKRFLAYSTISQIGFIIMGMGLAGCNPHYCVGDQCFITDGPYRAAFGSLYHIVNHGIIKAILFFASGAIIYSTGIRKIKDLGGLGRKMPVTGACFFLAGLSLAGVPLLNGFTSKLYLFIAGVKTPGMIWTTVIAVGASIFTLAGFLMVSYKVFYGEESEALKKLQIKEAPANMLMVMVFLSAICILLGIYPQIITPVIDNAAKVVMTLVEGG